MAADWLWPKRIIELTAEQQSHDFIVPTKAINELSRLLQPAGQLEVRRTPNQVAFTLLDDKGGSIQMISKLVDAPIQLPAGYSRRTKERNRSEPRRVLAGAAPGRVP